MYTAFISYVHLKINPCLVTKGMRNGLIGECDGSLLGTEGLPIATAAAIRPCRQSSLPDQDQDEAS
jgi:hypothetical protein